MDFNRYFEIGKGIVPIVLSCPHGGYLKPKNISDKLRGVNIADKVTFLTAKYILKLLEQNNIKIYYILSKIHRSKIDFNRPPKASNALNQRVMSSELAIQMHHFYHEKLKDLVEESINLFDKCFFIDFHGFTKPHPEYPDIIIGNVFGNTLDLKIYKRSREQDNIFWGYSQIVKVLSKKFTLDDGLGVNDYNLAYSGGYITHQFYKKNHVNAIQLEVAKYIRKNPKLLQTFVSSFVEAIKYTLKYSSNTYRE